MRVAFLTTDNRWVFNDYDNPTPHFGPAPEALLDGFAALPELTVHIVSCIRQPVASPDKLRDNVWFHSLYVPKVGWLRTGYQGCIRAVRKKLKELKPDIVHGQGTECDCALEAVLSGFPNVITIHGNMADSARVTRVPWGSYHWFAARFENFALKRTAGVFCNSRYTEQRVRSRTSRTWLVPNALRRRFFSIPSRAPRKARCVLMHVGVVCPNKQQLKMLEVARSLHSKGLDFEFHFIGSAHPGNDYARTFLREIREGENQGYAFYLKTKSADELIGAFDQASALVHTPVAEAFGLVVAEALSRDLKVFGFRVGGVPDIVEGADGAVLVPEGDWNALERAIESWLASGHLLARPTAQIMQERYHPDRVARLHLEIYHEVLGLFSHQFTNV
jgi:glycosyltransferase involved in cell wall biosynthesis